MTAQRQTNWRKNIWIVILVLVVAYAYGEPWLEKWTGLELPSIRDQGNVATVDPDEGDPGSLNREMSRQVDSNRSSQQDATQKKPEPKTNPSRSPTPNSTGKPAEIQDAARTTDKTENSFLVPTGKKDRLKSPAGLIYGMGPGGEHRVDHVMAHASDNRSRPSHSVFDGDREQILNLLDEAYELIKAKSDRVKAEPDSRLDFRVAYTVDMKRRVGYWGGKDGYRANHPPRSKITLVLDNDRFVVSAYPDK